MENWFTVQFEDFRDGSYSNGNCSFYAIAEQEISIQNNHSWNGFFQLGYSPQQNHNVVELFADLGITTQGFLSNRKDDSLGIAYLYTKFSEDYLFSRIQLGDVVSNSESVIELTYQISISDSFKIQPDLQYIIHAHEVVRNTTVVGLRVELSF